MTPELTDKFEALNARIDTTMARILAYSDEVGNAPAGKSFAPFLIPSHFVVVEDMHLTAFEKGKGKTDHSKLAKPRFFFPMVVKTMRKPVGKTVPAPASMVVQSSDPRKEGEKWKEMRAKIMAHIGDTEDNKVAVKNPMFGELSPNHLYDLLSAHHDYHDARLP